MKIFSRGNNLRSTVVLLPYLVTIIKSYIIKTDNNTMKPQEFRSKIVNCVSKWRIPFAVSLDLCAVGKGQNWPSLYNDILTGAVVIKQIDGVCDIIYILLQRIKVGPYERNILVNVIFFNVLHVTWYHFNASRNY